MRPANDAATCSSLIAIHFAGMDAGGLTAELFTCFFLAAFEPKLGLFTSCALDHDDSRACSERVTLLPAETRGEDAKALKFDGVPVLVNTVCVHLAMTPINRNLHASGGSLGEGSDFLRRLVSFASLVSYARLTSDRSFLFFAGHVADPERAKTFLQIGKVFIKSILDQVRPPCARVFLRLKACTRHHYKFATPKSCSNRLLTSLR